MNKYSDESFDLFMKGMAQTMFAFKDRLRRLMAENNIDLSPEQFVTLIAIEDFEGSSMSQLSKISPRDKTATTRMIDGLERLNLVTRVHNKSDRREVLIYLTTDGKKKIEEIKALKPKMPDITFKGVTTKELEITKNTLKKVRDNLKR